MISTLKQALFSLFFPPVCPFCKETKKSTNYFCFSCMQTIELSLEKKQTENSIQIYCFEDIEPMRSFFSSLTKEKHPKKIELAVSFFLLQLHQHKIEDIELIYCPHKRSSVYYTLSKNLSKKLQLPLVKTLDSCKDKSTLLLGKVSSIPSKAHCYVLTFLKSEFERDNDSIKKALPIS